MDGFKICAHHGAMMSDLEALLEEIRHCRTCAEHLPLGPNPVVCAGEDAKVLIIGQAPGTKVHETSIPWNDASGDRLRDWLQINRDDFYDSDRIAIMPMGFCYPGRAPNGGDNPPRPECAPLWHNRLREHLPNIELTLLIGMYAQNQYLGRAKKRTMTETARCGEEYGPELLPLPHPSWRNTAWIKKNPWFEKETLPYLRRTILKMFNC